MENICTEAFKIRKALNAYEAFKFGADCLRASEGCIEAAGLDFRSFRSFKSFRKYILLKPLKLITKFEAGCLTVSLAGPYAPGPNFRSFRGFKASGATRALRAI